MTDLLAARSQMAMSLGFHILFAVVGMGMPLLMVIAEARYLRTKEDVYLILAKRWAKGTAILFAVGAVSGTVLSFELGLLWPGFMQYAGPIIGMPFSLEGFAFFLEAIFLGIYLYGWDKITPKKHLFAGVMVLISGTLSGVFVVTANAWMNAPAGITRDAAGTILSIRPFEAMMNPAAFTQTLHMTLAAFVTVGFAVAAIHALMLLKDKDNLFHQKALGIAMIIGSIFAVLQPLSGDLSAKHIAKYQPAKLAAMEGHWETQKGSPLRLLGWPDEKTETTPYSIEIPYLLSFLAFGDFKAEVKGLKSIPKKERPPVAIVHMAFQIMVGAGLWMLFVGLLWAFCVWRKTDIPSLRWLLWLIVLAGPMGFLAVEAGWVVTEVGRQPWIIQGIMKTADAVTPIPGLVVPFLAFTILYIVLGFVVIVLLKRQVFQSPLLHAASSPSTLSGEKAEVLPPTKAEAPPPTKADAPAPEATKAASTTPTKERM